MAASALPFLPGLPSNSNYPSFLGFLKCFSVKWVCVFKTKNVYLFQKKDVVAIYEIVQNWCLCVMVTVLTLLG